MAADARDRLGRMPRGEDTSAFSVELKARLDDLALEVEGLGAVKFPVTAAEARKLIGLGRPARFGRGEETVTDPDVRDTWEVPKKLVRATWSAPMLAVILATVQEELGLPVGAELTADMPRPPASVPSPPTARPGCAPGSRCRSARTATGRSSFRPAAPASCALRCGSSWPDPTGSSNGRSPSSAGGTSTSGSAARNSLSPT